VSLEMHGPDVHVEFLIEHDDPTTRDDIEEIAFSFDALQTGPHSTHDIVVDARPLQGRCRDRQLVTRQHANRHSALARRDRPIAG